ncbi:MAG: YfhO family protein [Eubacteriales bacterium]|nr:YfhO family protein [Eubacteriales bacterium]
MKARRAGRWNGIPYVLLAVLTLLVCWLFVWRYGVFGAKVDWISQHSVFPDYFRQQFYETGELFPEFAGNIGGGQNIYNFAYYGLYNPVILISYLLPFVKMGDYLMAAGVAEIIISLWLIYYWLIKRNFSKEISLSMAVLFLLAGPVIYQSYHQVMFINYMPFLCMAFLGVDRYFEKGRRGLYTVSVFLMILSSFYFSIGGMLALVLYGISRYLELRESQKQSPGSAVWHFLKDGMSFLIPMLTAVLMSGVLLVPTAFAILGGREGSGMTDIGSLFIPDVQILQLAYSSYGIGLTTLIFTVLITGFTYRKWSERVLTYGCVLLFVLPVFSWLLNGGLYVRSKALIPFLPLLCYMMAAYLEKQRNREISFRINVTAYSLTLLLCYEHYRGQELAGEPLKWYLILADGILMLVSFLIFWRWRRVCILIIPSVACLFLYGSIVHRAYGEVMDYETYRQITDEETGKRIAEILDGEAGFYRVEQIGSEEEKAANLNRIWDVRQWISSVYSSAYHVDYQELRKDVFGVEEPFRNDLMQAASENPLFQKLMGVKYVVEGQRVYENEYAAPIAYATDKVIPQKDYDQLSFPYNQTALMQYAVVRNSRGQTKQWEEGAEIRTEHLMDECHIQEKKKTGVKYPVSGKEKERILYMQFRVKNNRPGQDVAVWVNGIRNKLSARGHIYYNGNTVFTYVTRLKEGQSDVEIVYGNGDYEISDIECYLSDSSVLEDADVLKSGEGNWEKLYQSEFQVNREQTKGNRIQGDIQVKNTGYFITSIPYDTGFEILVDGKRTAGEKVNTAFLGFSIAEGKHQIEIIYHAPGVRLGWTMTGLGILLLAITLIYQCNLEKKQKLNNS